MTLFFTGDDIWSTSVIFMHVKSTVYTNNTKNTRNQNFRDRVMYVQPLVYVTVPALYVPELVL